MYKLFKQKKIENQELQNSNLDCVDEVSFPSAQEMLKNAKNNWPIIDPIKVLNEIKAKSDSGNRIARFYNSTISEESIALFKEKGYKVETGVLSGSPYFKIFW